MSDIFKMSDIYILQTKYIGFVFFRKKNTHYTRVSLVFFNKKTVQSAFYYF